jgi:DNA-binding beta-propeller fold protein YncE
MRRMVVTGLVLLACVAVTVRLSPQEAGRVVAAKGLQISGREVPTFQVDPSWPKVPSKWALGPVSGLNVDSQDNVWVITRPREVLHPVVGKLVAPPIMEFDGEGNFIKGWGGPGQGYEWPDAEHGVTVDYKGFVWVAGRGKDDDQILKFTNDGKFVMQIGHSAQSRGNKDSANLNLPADVTVYPKTNEVFVADGYGNRRVIVFDADTGKYKRMWGAFGNIPTDPETWNIPAGWRGVVGHDPNSSRDDLQGEETLDGEQGPQQFANVHSVRVSNDGIVYVCDRANQRVQVFTLNGQFLAQVFISRGHMKLSNATGMLFGKPRNEIEDGVLRAAETASRISFSPDTQQQYLYVLDRRHQRILILLRKTLEIVGSFGDGVGDAPGQFYVLHDMATDSHGNFYTAEINENSRVQKFVFNGIVATPTK